VRDLEDARSRGFSNLPYKRLQQVKICVEATEDTAGRDDAGQIICLHFKMRDVADIIVQAAEGGLRNLNFDLVESERGEWYERGMPKRTILQIQDVPAYIPEWDFTIVWLPFYPSRLQFPSMDLTQDVPRKLFDWLKEPQNVENRQHETNGQGDPGKDGSPLHPLGFGPRWSSRRNCRHAALASLQYLVGVIL
jgi:hypothetical protein